MAAKTAYTVEQYKLLNGEAVEVRPLSIKKSRKATVILEDIIMGRQVEENGEPVMEEVEDEDGNKVEQPKRQPLTEDETIGCFLDIVLLAIEHNKNAAKFYDENDPENIKGKEELEDVLDHKTMYAIIKQATGTDFLAMIQRTEEMFQVTPATR